MKRSNPAIAVLLSLAVSGWAASPAPLTSLREIRSLTNEQAAQGLPVAFEATVTYFGGYEATLFVQDGGSAIYVLDTANVSLLPGDHVLIKGTVQPSFRPVVRSNDIAVLRHGAMPAPIDAPFGALIQGRLDCAYVAVRGVVRSAEITVSSGRHVSQLELAMDGGNAGVTLDSSDPARLKGLLDSEVEVSGVASGRFDSKMQLIGVLIHASSIDAVRILRNAPADAQSLPLTPMDRVLNAYDMQDRSQRVRVEGTLTYFHPASMAVLQDGNRSIRVLTPEIEPLRVGDRAEATGIPVVDDGFQALELGEIRTEGEGAPIVPLPVTWDALADGRNAFDLVSIEGKVVSQVREDAQDVYLISAGGQLFSAALRHPYLYDSKAEVELPPMIRVQPDSKVRVTGIAIFDGANRFNGALTFGILLRTASDVTVIANPSPLNVRNLILLAGLLLTVVVAFGARGWALERKVRRQATELAARIEADANLERRRSRILEDINGSRPLAEIIEQITGLVSLKLGGVPCWCQIKDGARLGTVPLNQEISRVVRQEIASRSGQPAGTLYAYLTLPGSLSAEGSEALAMGAGLAELAVENRRLYSDLLHRSEFDQLTDIHNRFALEKYLDALIVAAREKAGIFGLIYIDLDGFKQVNDLHGHRIGDLYLQEVALRMKRQLRSGDMLARIGGDEFAALLPMVHNRADAEDVARRLERSFDEPFAVEGVQLRGAASLGIALYPEDGATKDSLLNAADAAMYVAKHARQSLAEAEAGQPAGQARTSA
jgi:diguanylate cyclase (GGDEF)-like protein